MNYINQTKNKKHNNHAFPKQNNAYTITSEGFKSWIGKKNAASRIFKRDMKWFFKDKYITQDGYPFCMETFIQYLIKHKKNINKTDQLQLTKYYNEIFKYFCLTNNLEMALCVSDIQYPEFNSFITCVDHLHFTKKIEKWGLKMDKMTKEELEIFFISCCSQGQFRMMKRLLTKYPTLNVSSHDDSAFRILCAKNYLQLAKWLFSKYPRINISANNHEAINYAASESRCSGYYDVLFWLQSLNPILYEIREVFLRWDYDYPTKYEIYVHTEKWIRHVQIMYILWLASVHSPNKNSFIYLIPKDITRYMISFF